MELSLIGRRVVSREFDELDTRKAGQPFGGKLQHIWRHVRADPPPAMLSKMLSDAADSAPDLENHIRGSHAHIVQEKFRGACSARLQNRFVFGSADVHFGTRKRFRQRGPNTFVI